MPANRFFLDKQYIPDQTAHILDEELRHLRVIRIRQGEHIELVNGRGQLATAELMQLSKNEALVRIKEVHEEAPAKIAVILAQAIPRINRLDLILEKGTELGMTHLWLFPGDQGEREKISPQQEQRIHHVLVAAMKQSGRLWLPQVTLKPSLLQWTDLPEKTYFGDIEANAPLLVQAWQPAEKEIAFLVGPESGFSHKEIAHLRRLGAAGVSLHKNILRTDTAPLAALSVIYQMLHL